MPRIEDQNNAVKSVFVTSSDQKRAIRESDRGGLQQPVPPYQPLPQKPRREPVSVYVQNTDVDLKIKIAEEHIAENFLPLDFSTNEAIEEGNLENVADQAYIYVDNKGQPVKLSVISTLKRTIKWADLDKSTQQQIQSMITSATKAMTAADVNAYSKDETYSKEEVYTKPETDAIVDSLIVDGGRIV